MYTPSIEWLSLGVWLTGLFILRWGHRSNEDILRIALWVSGGILLIWGFSLTPQVAQWVIEGGLVGLWLMLTWQSRQRIR